MSFHIIEITMILTEHILAEHSRRLIIFGEGKVTFMVEIIYGSKVWISILIISLNWSEIDLKNIYLWLAGL